MIRSKYIFQHSIFFNRVVIIEAAEKHHILHSEFVQILQEELCSPQLQFSIEFFR